MLSAGASGRGERTMKKLSHKTLISVRPIWCQVLDDEETEKKTRTEKTTKKLEVS